MRARRRNNRREAAFALCLALVLAVGAVGVLLLNTAMQQQSRTLAAQHEKLSALALQAQQLRTRLDRIDQPARLAAHARRLHLRPAARVRFIGGALTPPRPAASSDRAG